MKKNCDRCGKACRAFIMSWFNTQEICMECSAVEKLDSRYQEARKAEAEALKRGERNFPGIGWRKEED